MPDTSVVLRTPALRISLAFLTLLLPASCASAAPPRASGESTATPVATSVSSGVGATPPASLTPTSSPAVGNPSAGPPCSKNSLLLTQPAGSHHVLAPTTFRGHAPVDTAALRAKRQSLQKEPPTPLHFVDFQAYPLEAGMAVTVTLFTVEDKTDVYGKLRVNAVCSTFVPEFGLEGLHDVASAGHNDPLVCSRSKSLTGGPTTGCVWFDQTYGYVVVAGLPQAAAEKTAQDMRTASEH